jgi:hypothetical protein
MIRSTLFALCALGSALCAQPYFVAPAGHSITEHTLTNPPSTTFIGGAAFDTTGNDVYYWDGVNIRRFDTTLNQPATTPLFTVPVAFGPYVDVMKFDPNTPSDLIVSDSGAFTLYRLRRAGLDSLASQSSGTVNLYIYDLAFDASGRMLVSAADATTFLCGIYLIDPVSLTERLLIDLSAVNVNGSGPLCFDAAGNLFSAVPPAFGQSSPGMILRFDRGAVDGAIASLPPTPGPAPLNASDGVMVIDSADNLPSMGRMGFRFEDGQEFLYYTLGAGVGVRKALLALKQDFAVFDAAPPQPGLTNFSSSLAFDSNSNFAPYGGGAGRLAVICGAQNVSFAVANHALAIIRPQASPAGVASLAITAAPAFVRNGVPFDVEVEVRDSSGAPVSGGAAVRVSASSPAGGMVFGQVTAAAIGGTVTVAGLVYSGPETALPSTIQFTATLVGGSVPPAQSAALPAYGLLGSLRVLAQPASVGEDEVFSISVELRDSTGQAITSGPDSTATISLSVFHGPGPLLGTISVAAVGGVATFSDLRLNAFGDFLLRASASGFSDGMSANIKVPPKEGVSGDSGCSTVESRGYGILAIALLTPLWLLTRRRRHVA